MAIGVVVSPFCMAIFISHVDHWDALVINSSERPEKKSELSSTLLSIKTEASQSEKAVPPQIKMKQITSFRNENASMCITSVKRA